MYLEKPSGNTLKLPETEKTARSVLTLWWKNGEEMPLHGNIYVSSISAMHDNLKQSKI